MKNVLLITLFILLIIVGCKQKNSTAEKNGQTLKSEWLKFRAENDSLFKYADWSPLTEEDRKNFTGLEYFDYDSSWRFTLTLHVYPNPESITITGTKKGDFRPALRYGYFEFSPNGVPCRLEVLKILPQSPAEKAHLFLGFWDETSGKETYGGGRYIDLKPVGENRFIVDFNYAYNPYCAYSDRYSCAIPPLSNRLPVAVRVGEKKYGNH
ncbi:MAG: DUF1684 domain-containing protein [Calditrichaeota bacterium]|nr:DUF1684 domain-containing protein [Calditrichota bacterium]